MGSIYLSSYTGAIPANAIIVGTNVIWKDRNGEKKQGKLVTTKDGSQKVFVETGFWIAKFTDENGKVKKVATKMKNRESAQKLLNSLENEVERIRSRSKKLLICVEV